MFTRMSWKARRFESPSDFDVLQLTRQEGGASTQISSPRRARAAFSCAAQKEQMGALDVALRSELNS